MNQEPLTHSNIKFSSTSRRSVVVLMGTRSILKFSSCNIRYKLFLIVKFTQNLHSVTVNHKVNICHLHIFIPFILISIQVPVQDVQIRQILIKRCILGKTRFLLKILQNLIKVNHRNAQDLQLAQDFATVENKYLFQVDEKIELPIVAVAASKANVAVGPPINQVVVIVVVDVKYPIIQVVVLQKTSTIQFLASQLVVFTGLLAKLYPNMVDTRPIKRIVLLSFMQVLLQLMIRGDDKRLSQG